MSVDLVDGFFSTLKFKDTKGEFITPSEQQLATIEFVNCLKTGMTSCQTFKARTGASTCALMLAKFLEETKGTAAVILSEDPDTLQEVASACFGFIPMILGHDAVLPAGFRGHIIIDDWNSLSDSRLCEIHRFAANNRVTTTWFTSIAGNLRDSVVNQRWQKAYKSAYTPGV